MKRFAVIVMLLGLCACSGSTPAPAGSTIATASAAASAGGVATPSGGGAATASSSPGVSGSPTPQASTAPVPTTVTPVVAKEACAFLSQQVSSVSAVKTTAKRRTRFKLAYSDWVGEDFSHQLSSSDQLDTLARAKCPKPRTKLLAELHGHSLAALLKG